LAIRISVRTRKEELDQKTGSSIASKGQLAHLFADGSSDAVLLDVTRMMEPGGFGLIEAHEA